MNPWVMGLYVPVALTMAVVHAVLSAGTEELATATIKLLVPLFLNATIGRAVPLMTTEPRVTPALEVDTL